MDRDLGLAGKVVYLKKGSYAETKCQRRHPGPRSREPPVWGGVQAAPGRDERESPAPARKLSMPHVEIVHNEVNESTTSASAPRRSARPELFFFLHFPNIIWLRREACVHGETLTEGNGSWRIVRRIILCSQPPQFRTPLSHPHDGPPAAVGPLWQRGYRTKLGQSRTQENNKGDGGWVPANCCEFHSMGFAPLIM